MDVGSQFARSALTFSNKLTRLATNRNARAGNIGRVLKGWVPSTKAAYGYVYRRDAEITQDGKVLIKKAWWDLDKLDTDGTAVAGSPADTVTRIFNWVGGEERTTFWVTAKLNEMGVRAPGGGTWSPNKVCRVIYHQCYTGKHRYNAYARVPNPKNPLGDITGAIRRSLLRPKAEGESVEFNVPHLVSEQLWKRANEILQRRGRGKQGRTIAALLRNHIYCPKCGRPMAVRRKSKQEIIYYYCSRYYHSWSPTRCSFHRFVPGSWGELVWDCVYALLMQDAWIEEHLGEAQNQVESISKLVKLEQQKTQQAQTKTNKIREGFEGGIYGIEEAKLRIDNCRDVIGKAEQQIKRLTEQINGSKSSAIDIPVLRDELKRMAERNLEQATFQEKLDIITKLGIRIYPSDDLKTVKIKCGLNLDLENTDGLPDTGGCRIVTFGLPCCIKSRTPTLSSSEFFGAIGTV